LRRSLRKSPHFARFAFRGKRLSRREKRWTAGTAAGSEAGDSAANDVKEELQTDLQDVQGGLDEVTRGIADLSNGAGR
jgi:hypothetical protein